MTSRKGNHDSKQTKLFTNVYVFFGHYNVIFHACFDMDRHSYNRQERWRVADLISLIGLRLSLFRLFRKSSLVNSFILIRVIIFTFYAKLNFLQRVTFYFTGNFLWRQVGVFSLTSWQNFHLVRATVNIPIQTRILSPRPLLLEMIFPPPELAPPVHVIVKKKNTFSPSIK